MAFHGTSPRLVFTVFSHTSHYRGNCGNSVGTEIDFPLHLEISGSASMPALGGLFLIKWQSQYWDHYKHSPFQLFLLIPHFQGPFLSTWQSQILSTSTWSASRCWWPVTVGLNSLLLYGHWQYLLSFSYLVLWLSPSILASARERRVPSSLAFNHMLSGGLWSSCILLIKYLWPPLPSRQWEV